MGGQCRVDPREFAHQVVVHVQTTGGVEDHRVDALLARLGDRALADVNRDADRFAVRGGLVRLGVERDRRAAWEFLLDLLADNAQLLNRGGALEVGGDEHARATGLLEVPREFAAGGGLPAPLEAAHHDDGGARAHAEHTMSRALRCAHEADQFLMDDPDEFLSRLEALGDLASLGRFGDLGAELVDHVEVHVGLEQRRTDLVERLSDVRIADPALTGDLAHRVGEPI